MRDQTRRFVSGFDKIRELCAFRARDDASVQGNTLHHGTAGSFSPEKGE